MVYGSYSQLSSSCNMCGLFLYRFIARCPLKSSFCVIKVNWLFPEYQLLVLLSYPFQPQPTCDATRRLLKESSTMSKFSWLHCSQPQPYPFHKLCILYIHVIVIVQHLISYCIYHCSPKAELCLESLSGQAPLSSHITTTGTVRCERVLL